MAAEPDDIRARIDALLAELPAEIESDLDEMTRRLDEAHDVLVQALDSVEKG
jgi:hypothetical protein